MKVNNIIIQLYTVQITVQIYSNVCTVENLFAIQVGACTQDYHTSSLSFIDKFIDYSSWRINLLECILVWSVAVYFYSLLRPTGSSKYSTNSKNIQRYYTPKHLVRFIYCMLFLFM